MKNFFTNIINKLSWPQLKRFKDDLKRKLDEKRWEYDVWLDRIGIRMDQNETKQKIDYFIDYTLVMFFYRMGVKWNKIVSAIKSFSSSEEDYERIAIWIWKKSILIWNNMSELEFELREQMFLFKNELFEEIHMYSPQWLKDEWNFLLRQVYLNALIFRKSNPGLSWRWSLFFTLLIIAFDEHKKFFAKLKYDTETTIEECGMFFEELKSDWAVMIEEFKFFFEELKKDWVIAARELKILYRKLKVIVPSSFIFSQELKKDIFLIKNLMRKNLSFFLTRTKKKFYLYVFYIYIYSFKLVNLFFYYVTLQYFFLFFLLLLIYWAHLSVGLILSFSVIFIFIFLLKKFAVNKLVYTPISGSDGLVVFKKFIENFEKNDILSFSNTNNENLIFLIIFDKSRGKFISSLTIKNNE